MNKIIKTLCFVLPMMLFVGCADLDLLPTNMIAEDAVKNDPKLDAVFGTRFSKNSKITGYPFLKLIINRVANNFIRVLFFSNYNDFTNAFKIYKRNFNTQS